MNKTLVTHGAWLLISVAAFAVGGKVLSSKSASDEPAQERGSRLTAMPDKSIEEAGKSGNGKMTDLPSDYIQSLETLSKGGDPKAFVQAFLNEGDALEANKMFADLLLNLTTDNAREIFDALREGGGADGNFGRDMGLFLQASSSRISGAVDLLALPKRSQSLSEPFKTFNRRMFCGQVI